MEEGRILASRERCPYLVHLEVAETGLRGSDSRLYASGAPGMGATIEEALGLNAQASSAVAASDANRGNYHIPSELLPSPSDRPQWNTKRPTNTTLIKEPLPENKMSLPRGGWQADEAFYNPEDIFASNPYDSVRENEYQQLHEQMHSEYGMMEQPLEQRYVIFENSSSYSTLGLSLIHLLLPIRPKQPTREYRPSFAEQSLWTAMGSEM